MINVLAARAPDLRAALDRAEEEGLPHLILDGKIVDTDRLHVKTVSKKGKEIDRWYSGKTHDFGGNIQAVMSPRGIPLWISDVLPGNVHDLEAARQQVLDIIRPYTKGNAGPGRSRLRRCRSRHPHASEEATKRT